MDNLFCDTLFLLVSGDLGEDGRRRRYNRFSSAPTRSLQGDRHALYVDAPRWGKSDFRTESVAARSRYCRMSGLLMRPLLAAGPYGVREIGSKSESRAQWPSRASWFFRSRLVDRLPLPEFVRPAHIVRQLSLLSLLSFRRRFRRQCEPDRSPCSCSMPR